MDSQQLRGRKPLTIFEKNLVNWVVDNSAVLEYYLTVDFILEKGARCMHKKVAELAVIKMHVRACV
jgi:hypothetical protein